jgi:hypothetical protein
MIVPAIVDRSLWERVQARLAENPNNGRPTARYLLRGLLYCGRCGRRMHGVCTHDYRYYRCHGWDALRHSGTVCRATVGAVKIETAVWGEIERSLTDSYTLSRLLGDFQADLRVEAPAKLDTLRAKLRRAQAREDQALRLLLDPDMAESRRAVKLAHREAQAERRRIAAQIHALEQADRGGDDGGNWVEDTARLLRGYIQELTETPERQEFMRGLVSKAELSGNEVTMSVFLPSKLTRSPGRSGQFPSVQLVLTARLAA